MPQFFCSDVGAQGPLHSSVMHPWSEPRDFRVQWVDKITKWGLFHFRSELFLRVADFLGFQIYPVSCLEWVEGQVSEWKQHVVTKFSDCFHGFSYVESILELFHFKEIKEFLLLGVGNGSTILRFKCILSYPLGLTVCGAGQ